MSNATVSRVGQINATGAVDALFLKKFAGEVLATFETNNVMKPLHTIRTIDSGKSAQFPVTGTAVAAYHAVGVDIIPSAQSIKHAERIINIDELLIAHAFISNIDEAKNHYDVRSTYTTELGRALAKRFDKNLLRVTCAAGLTGTKAATITGGFDGTSVDGVDTSSGDAIVAALFKAAENLDNSDVPQMDRYVVLNPAAYYKIVNSARAINVDWRGDGSIATGKVCCVAGINVFSSNNLPSTNITSKVTGETNDDYLGDFSSVFGVVFQKGAVGTVKLLDLAVESDYLIQNQGTLFVAKYAMGHAILRPESVCVLQATTTP